MLKIKNKISLFLCVMVLISLLVFAPARVVNAHADEGSQYDTVVSNSSESAQRGLIAFIDLGISGKDGRIYADAYNKSTLGLSTIRVYVQLYRSETYQESYENMTFLGQAYDNDLDMFETLTFHAPTDGKTFYWQARMRYRMDNNEWVSVTTGPLLYDGDANLLSAV